MPTTLSRRISPIVTRLALPAALAVGIVAAPARAVLQPASAPADIREADAVTPSTGGSNSYVLDPIAPNAIGVHVNMPTIRHTTHGWDRFAEIVEAARNGGHYLLLNNMDRERQGPHVAATFDNWTFTELMTFSAILADSRVPVLMYVGAIETPGVFYAVPPARLITWRNDVLWLRAITGANAGLVIDASVIGIPDTAPGGMTFLGYYSQYARAMTPIGIEVGFEALRLDNQDRPLEDRRYYGLLQWVVSRFSTLPSGADFDARIMSAIDALPAAKTDLRNTVWLNNSTWDELADGDHVPAAWLNAWGVTPDQLQSTAATRLYEKGYGLIFSPSAFGVE